MMWGVAGRGGAGVCLGELLRRRVRTVVVVDGTGEEGGVFRGLLEDMRRAQASLDCAFLPVQLAPHRPCHGGDTLALPGRRRERGHGPVRPPTTSGHKAAYQPISLSAYQPISLSAYQPSGGQPAYQSRRDRAPVRRTRDSEKFLHP